MATMVIFPVEEMTLLVWNCCISPTVTGPLGTVVTITEENRAGDRSMLVLTLPLNLDLKWA